jgi:hypothetical protein
VGHFRKIGFQLPEGLYGRSEVVLGQGVGDLFGFGFVGDAVEEAVDGFISEETGGEILDLGAGEDVVGL